MKSNHQPSRSIPIYITILLFIGGSIILSCNSSTPKENKEKFLTLLNRYDKSLYEWDSSYGHNLPDLKEKDSSLRVADKELHRFTDKLIDIRQVQIIRKSTPPNVNNPKENSAFTIRFKYDNTSYILQTEGSWQINLPPPGQRLP